MKPLLKLAMTEYQLSLSKHKLTQEECSQNSHSSSLFSCHFPPDVWVNPRGILDNTGGTKELLSPTPCLKNIQKCWNWRVISPGDCASTTTGILFMNMSTPARMISRLSWLDMTEPPSTREDKVIFKHCLTSLIQCQWGGLRWEMTNLVIRKINILNQIFLFGIVDNNWILLRVILIVFFTTIGSKLGEPWPSVLALNC